MDRTMRGRLERILTSSIYGMNDKDILQAYALLKPCDNCYARNCKVYGKQSIDTMDCYNAIYDYVKEDEQC